MKGSPFCLSFPGLNNMRAQSVNNFPWKGWEVSEKWCVWIQINPQVRKGKKFSKQ